MGADMLLTACVLPIDENGEQLNRTVADTVVRARIAVLDDDVLLEVNEWFLEDEVDPDEDGWQERVRQRLRACLAVFDDDRRDTAELCLGGRWWLFAGGLSWGDAPSDAYEMVVGLSIACVTEEAVSTAELAAANARTDDKED